VKRLYRLLCRARVSSDCEGVGRRASAVGVGFSSVGGLGSVVFGRFRFGSAGVGLRFYSAPRRVQGDQLTQRRSVRCYFFYRSGVEEEGLMTLAVSRRRRSGTWEGCDRFRRLSGGVSAGYGSSRFGAFGRVVVVTVSGLLWLRRGGRWVSRLSVGAGGLGFRWGVGLGEGTVSRVVRAVLGGPVR